MFECKLNNKIFKGNVYHNDSIVGTIFFELVIINNKIYAEEVVSKIIFPISCEIYKTDIYDLICEDKIQFYVRIYGKLKINNNGNIIGNNVVLWCLNEIAAYNDFSDYSNYFLANFKKIINSIEITCLNSILKGENNMSDNKKREYDSNQKVKLTDVPECLSELNNTESEIFGRENEIKELIKTTCILGKSVILLGEAGTGKTSIVEGLANEINNSNKYFLKNKVICELNANSLISGTKYRGEFSEKLNKVINFALKNKEYVILFIDEVHILYGLGKTEDSSIDAINILKPYIERGDIIMIGATTYEEYNDGLANDKAFTSRFKINKIKPLDDKTINIIILNYMLYLKRKYTLKVSLNESQIINLVEELLNIAKHQDIRHKINPIRLIKRIMESAFAEAIYQERLEVTITDFVNAILESNEIIIQNKQEYVAKLNEKLGIQSPKNSKIYYLNPKKSKIYYLNPKNNL